MLPGKIQVCPSQKEAVLNILVVNKKVILSGQDKVAKTDDYENKDIISIYFAVGCAFALIIPICLNQVVRHRKFSVSDTTTIDSDNFKTKKPNIINLEIQI